MEFDKVTATCLVNPVQINLLHAVDLEVLAQLLSNPNDALLRCFF